MEIGGCAMRVFPAGGEMKGGLSSHPCTTGERAILSLIGPAAGEVTEQTGTEFLIATGRRKSSSARVFLKPGSGKITVNDRPLDEFFGRETGRMIVRQPLELVQLTNKFDITVTATGAGDRLPHRGLRRVHLELRVQVRHLAGAEQEGPKVPSRRAPNLGPWTLVVGAGKAQGLAGAAPALERAAGDQQSGHRTQDRLRPLPLHRDPARQSDRLPRGRAGRVGAGWQVAPKDVERYRGAAESWIAAGATLVGSCCGTGLRL